MQVIVLDNDVGGRSVVDVTDNATVGQVFSEAKSNAKFADYKVTLNRSPAGEHQKLKDALTDGVTELCVCITPTKIEGA